LLHSAEASAGGIKVFENHNALALRTIAVCEITARHPNVDLGRDIAVETYLAFVGVIHQLAMRGEPTFHDQAGWQARLLSRGVVRHLNSNFRARAPDGITALDAAYSDPRETPAQGGR
jgi:cytochrome c5